MSLLQVRNLTTAFQTGRGEITAVEDVTFDLNAGEILGIVGESGSGKSVTALTIMGLLPRPPARIAAGSVRFDGEDLTHLSDRRMQHVRGPGIAMVFQEPMTSLNPVFTIGDQIMETIRAHERLPQRALFGRAVEMLEKVGIASAATRMADYPHQLSGGQRQRVMLAIALVCRPRLLIADEPTTALDVTIQAQILDLMLDLRDEFGMAIMLITHNMGVIAEAADRVIVMYAGRIVEEAPVATLFDDPRHPYTRGLLECVPSLATERERLIAIPRHAAGTGPPPARLPLCPALPLRHPRVRVGHPALDTAGRRPHGCLHPYRGTNRRMTALIEASGVSKHYPVETGGFLRRTTTPLRAVDTVSLTVNEGETLGLVGESGCGKSTLGRLLIRLLPATAGTIRFGGTDITALEGKALRDMRRSMQIIFQDPYGALNPRMTVEAIVSEPLAIHGEAENAAKRVTDMLSLVGLPSRARERFPHEFSGGQRQRIGIARALILNPKFVVCDEPVSALDVSVQAQIVNLLQDLQGELGLTYLFIAHDLGVVKHISTRVAVMYLGKVVEVAAKDTLYTEPKHPYTRGLIASVPVTHPAQRARGRAERKRLEGDIPSALNPPSGCRFHTRCPLVQPICMEREPAVTEPTPGHSVACHLAE